MPFAKSRYSLYQTSHVIAVSSADTARPLGSINGRLVMIRCIIPNLSATQTTTIDIRDENDALIWHIAGLAETTTHILMPEQGTASGTAPDWAAGVPVPLASNLKGVGFWDVNITLSANQTGSTATIPVDIYYEAGG